MVGPTFDMSKEAARREAARKEVAPWGSVLAYVTIVLEVIAWLLIPVAAFVSTAYLLLLAFGLLLLAAALQEGLASALKDPILLFFRRGATPCSFRLFSFGLRLLALIWIGLLGFGSLGRDLYRLERHFHSSRDLRRHCTDLPGWLQERCEDGKFPAWAYTECMETAPWHLSGWCNYTAAGAASGLSSAGGSVGLVLIFGPMVAPLCLVFLYGLEACCRCCSSDANPRPVESKDEAAPTPGLIQKILVAKDIFLVALDFLLDSSCVVTFFLAGHRWFGAVAFGILLWSVGQQVAENSLKTMHSEAVASISAGMLSDGLLKLTRSEKSVEAPLSLMLQVYAFPYVSISSRYAVASFSFSILTSIYTISGAVYKLLYLDLLPVVASGQREVLREESYAPVLHPNE
ncbi:unnamed protein product [Symbiodinium necroappetens]|uniref:Uncharacterized protein n=1 Tax=Symbiodinium necroappetens TaxID=1628268 RepID=A0A813BRX1_9DINO|nr:unnamed protein product [Symbiodinium necroappetens]